MTDGSEGPGAGNAGSGDRDLFRILVEGVKEYAIFMLDPTGVVVSWNAGAERIKGYRAEEIIGRHFSVFYPREDAASGKPDLELREAAAHGSYEEEGWRVRKDGSRFLASVVLTALRDASGELTGFAKVTRDLTEKRRGEEARRGLVRAREAVRTRDDFLAIASHELRTPLTSLQLLVQSLARGLQPGQPVTPTVVQRLGNLEKLVARLAGLVNGLLDVTAMASGQLALERSSFDLAALVAELVDRLAPEVERQGGTVVLQAASAVPGRWDRRRLADAIGAVLSNAAKYAGADRIVVDVSVHDELAVVSIDDQGPGISAEDQARVFERFERAVPVVHYGGFGLGLWSARQIVTAHGGEIGIRSAPGQGSCFQLRLPRDG
ncbi:PAS domain-containing sensor histidine kinase [Anaeromyxobacter oryzae]|uniref:PAS domain-containing sensor histidine kinase n=1 Tax=Anaeromyxobacter oryzae TaxID=2918170 RepID=UPI0020BFFF97|nr:PAS domain-containing sensor histidine kinase [Anaeromyxobacter oryzae]